MSHLYIAVEKLPQLHHASGEGIRLYCFLQKLSKDLGGCLKSKALARGRIELMGEGSQLSLVDLCQISVAGQIPSDALVDVLDSTFLPW